MSQENVEIIQQLGSKPSTQGGMGAKATSNRFAD